MRTTCSYTIPKLRYYILLIAYNVSVCVCVHFSLLGVLFLRIKTKFHIVVLVTISHNSMPPEATVKDFSNETRFFVVCFEVN